MRNLILVLGDQLNRDASAFDGFESSKDAVLMVEANSESTYVWSHKARIALFLAGMRHFRNRLREDGIEVYYHDLEQGSDGANRDDLKITKSGGDLVEIVGQWISHLKPESLIFVEPGEWRLRQALIELADRSGTPFEIREDRHFICSHEEFDDYAKGKKQLRLEFFYRGLRRKHEVLMEGTDPEGGQWNYDSDNRKSFPKAGPPNRPTPLAIAPGELTLEVFDVVERQFKDHPGELKHFDWAVTPEDAMRLLDDFIENRLALFGQYQDAMWTEEPYLFHSRISAALNLKLLDPRDAIERATDAYGRGDAPLNAVEGFVRQILGWREYVRGIYWRFMPEYVDRNALQANAPLPDFFWTGDTEMECLRSTLRQTLDYGYAHHIQRLMVTGLFAMLMGVDPKQVHQWYLAVYVDAVEWVELPNSLGMSQFADGGVMASKPYAATGKYIQRMSNYCSGCRYDPAKATGEDACPFTTQYWDFLQRHRPELEKNPRMKLQVRNLGRKSTEELDQIQKQAAAFRNAQEASLASG